jgi:biopolymer transport protein ExbD
MAAQSPKPVDQPAERPKKKKGQHPVKPELNVIPLVDVMFMMILFFVLGTTFRQNEGQIPATLPRVDTAAAQSDTPPEEVPRPINVRITGGGLSASGEQEEVNYQVAGIPTVIKDPQELYEKLSGMKQVVGDKAAIIIQPTMDTKWQYAVEVFNQAVRAQFKSIGFSAMAG